jgi:hypothetical protein
VLVCVTDSFFPQFLEILWDEEIPLNWDVLYGGGAPTHSFAHVFSKACFDQCVTVNAAIDNCLKNRGRFGSSCGPRCSSQHGQEDMCDICGMRSSMCYVTDRIFWRQLSLPQDLSTVSIAITHAHTLFKAAIWMKCTHGRSLSLVL